MPTRPRREAPARVVFRRPVRWLQVRNVYWTHKVGWSHIAGFEMPPPYGAVRKTGIQTRLHDGGVISAKAFFSPSQRARARIPRRRVSLVVDRPPAEVAAMAGSGDEIAAGAGGRPHMRASHADREQVIDLLKTAFVQGRLAKDEFDLRVGQVLASRTYADLNALTADIPAGLIRVQSPNPARKPATVPTPKAVRDAVWHMRLGAVLTLAVPVTVLLTLGGVRWGFVHDPAAGQWHTFMLTQIVPGLATAPVGAGVWLWLAWANGRGYHWARPAFVALFSLLTAGLLFGLSEGVASHYALSYTWPDVIAATMLWLVGLAAMLLIFGETASPYYQR